jgi:hypothetical protein
MNNPFTLKSGDPVAVGLREPVGDSGAYVGWVESMTPHGFFTNLVDWIIGHPSGRVVFVPWDMVFALETAEEGAESKFFNIDAQVFQTQHTDYLLKKFDIDKEHNKAIRERVAERYLNSRR